MIRQTLAAAFVLLATAAQAQMTPIVRMDCRGGAAWPNCGAGRTVGNDSLGTKWTRAYIAAEDAVEIAMTPGAAGEGYYGWQWTGFPTPALGSTRVLRAKIKVVSPVNWGDWGDKFMVVGDVQNNASQRIISTMSLYQGQPHLNVDKNIDGRYAHGFLTPDRYTAVQIVAAPIAPGSSTYNFKFYVDGVLTRTSVNFAIAATTWRDFNVGYYGQYGSGGHVRIRFKDVEFDDEYDPAYHTGTTPPPSCTWAVTPTTLTFGAAVDVERDVTVTASREGCAWSTTGAPSWLTVSQTATSVRVTAAANTATIERSATLTIAGHPVTVAQAGAPVVEPPPVPVPSFSGTVEMVYVEGRVTAIRIVPRP
jgi:hypothetical protein